MSTIFKFCFNVFDQLIYSILKRSVGLMPMRFTKLIANSYPDARIRKLYLACLGLSMGDGTYSNLGLKICIDEIPSSPKVVIGNNVSIAPNVTFIADACANNGIEINKIPYVRDSLTVQGSVYVSDEVWIGAGVTIMPNVKIGRCAVIGAGSLVLEDVEPNSIYAGVPARKIRKLLMS